MVKGYSKKLRERAQKIKNILKKYYPLRSGLEFKNNYQLFVAVVLSAQCTDKKVNEVTKNFFKLYPNFRKLSHAKLSDVEKAISQVNYYKTKARNLLLTAKKLQSNRLPLDYDKLTSLPGVGDKTAQVILACNGIPSFPVDTHVSRVASRLGLVKAKKREEISKELKSIFSKNDWINMHHALIWHGRQVCKSIKPRCHECIISSLCPSKNESGK